MLEDERDVAKVKYESVEYLALSPFSFKDSPLHVGFKGATEKAKDLVAIDQTVVVCSNSFR